MSPDPAPAGRLPLLGEATRPAEREVLSAGQTGAESGSAGSPAPVATGDTAPIVVLHGVGSCAQGDVIGEIARQPMFARADDFMGETLYVREFRFAQLRDRGPRDGQPGRVRLLEVNWSEVRRPMPNLLGLFRNFVALLMALTRVGVYGAYRSKSLSQRLLTGVLTLWLVEALLVWAALAPALSALLWQLGEGQRMAAGAIVAAGSLYIAVLVRDLSRPLAVGGVVFAVFAAGAGWWSCYVAGGQLDVCALSALVHTWSMLLAATSVLLSAAEILLRPAPRGSAGPWRWMHHLSRLACLWLPLVLLVVAQPLTVTATLLTMDPPMRTRWGQAFARDMPFSPVDAQQAASWVALSLVASLLLGALLFKLVQRYGRNATALLGWGSGLLLLGTARTLELGAFDGCELCQRCLRTEWVGATGLLLVLGASVTWVLFARTDVALDSAGRAWFPAGAFARFWAGVMLAAMPMALTATLVWLWWRSALHGPQDALADASEIFLQSAKYALLLSPLATKPFAAFLDAVGDVFFFLVRQRNLNTRHDTQPRLWQALRHLGTSSETVHLVVFAHSQGTVIAAGILSRMVRALLRSRVRLTLVTVGSPITTLYRNFFDARVGAEYAALCRDQPERFRWFNLYRPADYIGGEVELEGVVNRDLLTPGDHVGYWSDRQLLLWLKALSQERAA